VDGKESQRNSFSAQHVTARSREQMRRVENVTFTSVEKGRSSSEKGWSVTQAARTAVAEWMKAAASCCAWTFRPAWSLASTL
jgi:hypothetical protein